jgi:hypothetical protein
MALIGCWLLARIGSTDLGPLIFRFPAGSVEYSVWQAAASLLLLFFL